MALNIDGTTGISGVDGSASAPAVTGTDSNTGINFASDTVNINTGGITRATVDSSGRVGIGTTSFNDAAEYLLVKNDSTAANVSIVASNDAHSSLNLGDEDDFNIQKIKSDHTNNSLQIFTNNTERMRIDSSGNVLVGTTSTSLSSSNFGIGLFANNSASIFMDVSGATTVVRMGGNQGLVKVQGDGDLFNTNNTYGQASDETLKQDIVDAASQWNDIKNLRVRKFRFKDNPTGVLQIGVVAQETEKVSPGLVQEDSDGIKSVKYSVLYMKAIKALQEAQARIETLETENTQMQTDLTALTARVTALEAA